MERLKLSTQQASEVVGAGLARNLNNQPITPVQNPPVQETPFLLELAHELLETYGSPLYVYQSDRLRQTIGHITQAIPYPRTHFHFASVTNGNVALLQIFQASGWGLHANTPGDIYLGLQAGFDPSQIVYSGSNLNRAEMEQVLNWGVTTLNLDSLAQLRLCCEVYQSLQASVKAPHLGLRLNLPELTGDSRIGVRPTEFPEAIALTQQAGLKLSGLHFYRGTGTNATKAFTQVIDTVLATAKLLPDWEYLDFGGGFGYPYHHHGAAFDWEMFGVELTQRLSRLGRDINLVIEPGRAALAGCATLLAQVVSVKWQDEKQILGVDTTVANLSVPSVHGGYREIVTWVGMHGDVPLHPTDVCGNTTYSRDYLGRNCQLAALEIGDIIAIWDVGAYGYAMSSRFYRASQSSELNYQQRQNNAKNLKIIGGLLLGIGIITSIAFDLFSIFVVSVILGMLSIYLGTRPTKPQAEISQSFLFPQNQFQEWLNRWNQVNGQIPKILPSPREESTPALVSPEVSAYSFDRLVVCDSAAIAQLLIANNFHFENNCAVLSITGYPQSIFSTVMDMLRRNPELKVYALHDATPRGVGLLHRLRSSSSWFGNSNVAIIDLGLLPRQLFSSRKVFVQSSDASAQAAKQLPAPVREQLSTEELDWLESGKFVELESFTPQKLMQVVTQGIAGSRNLDLESEDSGLILVGDTGSVYASDSFG